MGSVLPHTHHRAARADRVDSLNAGSIVLDRVNEKEGEKPWPQPYDHRVDGTARQKKALALGR